MSWCAYLDLLSCPAIVQLRLQKGCQRLQALCKRLSYLSLSDQDTEMVNDTTGADFNFSGSSSTGSRTQVVGTSEAYGQYVGGC